MLKLMVIEIWEPASSTFFGKDSQHVVADVDK